MVAIGNGWRANLRFKTIVAARRALWLSSQYVTGWFDHEKHPHHFVKRLPVDKPRTWTFLSLMMRNIQSLEKYRDIFDGLGLEASGLGLETVRDALRSARKCEQFLINQAWIRWITYTHSLLHLVYLLILTFVFPANLAISLFATWTFQYLFNVSRPTDIFDDLRLEASGIIVTQAFLDTAHHYHGAHLLWVKWRMTQCFTSCPTFLLSFCLSGYKISQPVAVAGAGVGLRSSNLLQDTPNIQQSTSRFCNTESKEWAGLWFCDSVHNMLHVVKC